MSKSMNTTAKVEHTLRSDHLHSLMELVDQQIHAIPVSPEAEGYITFLNDLKDRVTAMWLEIRPGQEAVYTIREQAE